MPTSEQRPSLFHAIARYRRYLWVEWFILYIFLPSGIVLFDVPHFMMFIILWGVTLWATWLLWHTPGFNRRRFWANNRLGLRKRPVTDVIVWFLPSAFLIIFYTYFFEEELWLNFVLEHTQIWLLVMIFYPILSVYPQEMIYRAFYFERYKTILTTPASRILSSAVLFGYLHVILQNGVAIMLSAMGGYYFAYRYHKYRSLLLVSIEHSLYGCLVFTVGLGWYFYAGAAR